MRKAKQGLAILLAALMLVLSVPAAFGAEIVADCGGEGFQACVATDIHYAAVDELPKRDGAYVYYDNLGLLPTLAPRFLQAFLQKVAACDADYVFLTGDITDTPDKAQARLAAKRLRRFERESGKQVFVINGNHDIVHTEKAEKSQITRASFRKLYADFGYNEALAQDTATCSYTADLKNGWRLLAIDALDIPGDGGATIDEALQTWIRDQAEAAARDGVRLVALMHHPLMEHFTLMKKLLPIFVVSNSDEACELFASCGVSVVFTGHFHQNDVAYSDKGVYDVQTTSLSCYPSAFREVRFSSDSADFHTVCIDQISAKNLPKGYTVRQKKAIATDLSGYMYDCLAADSARTVRGYLNAQKIKGLLHLSGVETPLLNAIVTGVADGFDLPLYGGGDSVQAYASRLGLTLPQTEFKTMNDVATAFIAAQFAGDENFDAQSPLFRVALYGGLALLARSAEQTLGKGALGQVLAVLQAHTSDARQARLFDRWSRSLCGGKFARDPMTPLLALAQPLLLGLTVDKPPADNEVTLQF